MNWADIAILSIIGISALISLFRGFIREVLSLVAWIIAFWVAFTFTEPVSGLLQGVISFPSGRYIAAFLALFIGTLIAIGVVNFLIGRIIESSGLSGTDRLLGVVFGMVRGLAVVVVIVFLAGATPLPKDPWWRESMFLDHFQAMAEIAIGFLPPDLAKYFSYS